MTMAYFRHDRHQYASRTASTVTTRAEISTVTFPLGIQLDTAPFSLRRLDLFTSSKRHLICLNVTSPRPSGMQEDVG